MTDDLAGLVPEPPALKLSDMIGSDPDVVIAESEPEPDPVAAFNADLAAQIPEPLTLEVVEDQEEYIPTLVTPPTPEPVDQMELIAQLQRQAEEGDRAVAEARAKAAALHPKAEADLSPEERKVRELQDRIARQQAALLEAQEPTFDDATGAAGGVLLIHILKEGGITLNSTSWYKGQEIEFIVGSQAYLDTFDRLGFSPLLIAGDSSAQIAKWGEIRYGAGPWPGRPSEDPGVIAAEANRRRRAPVLPTR